MSRTSAIMCVGLLASLAYHSSVLAHDHLKEHQLDVHFNAIFSHQDSGWTWLDGGMGRFGYGETAYDITLAYEVDIDYRYQFTNDLSFHTYVQAQTRNENSSAREIGLVEWALTYSNDLDFSQQIRFKLGQFFLPTSMENIDRFWDSPYTINYSSLNSWIGEEFRPIGLDARYRYHFDSGERMSIAATAFGGNDSMGALLAFRGWSYGRLKTVLGDVVALPDLEVLADYALFGRQRDDGTKPFGRDLDDSLGYALRGLYEAERLTLSVAWVDNRGDNALHHGEYAWQTEFAIVGASWFPFDFLEVLGEGSIGSTQMGSGPGVDVDFYSAYLMASYFSNGYRISFRHDLFGSEDKDDMDEENHDFGRSQTLAFMWEGNERPYKAGIEFMYLNSERFRTMRGGNSRKDEESVSISALFQYRW